MAKTIRPILCPQCGSPAKTPLGPDRFRCDACQTEYYFDTDDVTVTVRHQYATPAPVVRPPLSWGQRVAIGLCALVGVGVVVWLVLLIAQPRQSGGAAMVVAKPIFYLTHYVYADAARQPVYVTLRTQAPRWGSDSLTLYADFFDPRIGRLRREQVLEPLGRHPDDHRYTWHTFPNGQTYLLGNEHLYRVDTRANQLADVTNTLLADYAPASSGVAELTIDPYKEALRVLTNDGKTLYYLPATGRVFADEEAFSQAAKAAQPPRYFSLEQPYEPGLNHQPYQLLRYRAGAPPLDLTNGRRFFEPRILYQAPDVLLIDGAPTAKPGSPRLVQRLDPATGRVLWSLPASCYDVQEAVRTPDGFALHYRTDSELDYVHGALLLADDGRVLHDFQRKRME
ncbi:zinc ribbon domain-containing protein [Hymenobacter nivis]|uniref:Uncharacterized protein n=1 Tax=Hymenobacter nivis TaxID=1850093 RepID=A0A502GVW6_9BACT|nr:zinc ribbon domain-containing protein [Hymenobacter nivis]TPG66537.1 hypothetical protein EAH73_09035 [Hymenobacter nivis]